MATRATRAGWTPRSQSCRPWCRCGPPWAQTRRTYYCYVVRVDWHRFDWQDVGPLVAMLGAELRVPVEYVYRPLNDHPLYRPATRRSLTSAAARAGVDPARLSLPNAREPTPRGSRFITEIGDVIRAFHKVWNHLRAPR